MKAAALIVAAGRGTRAGSAHGPKQYVSLAGVPMLARSLAPFLRCPSVDCVRVAVHPDDQDLYARAVAALPDRTRLLPLVIGGATRQASVRLGLEALAAENPDVVLVHDAARPFVTVATIEAILNALEHHTGAIAANPVSDTIKRAGPGGLITETIPRQDLWRAQTPQGFRFATLLAAHRRAADLATTEFTDDAAIAEWAGIAVTLVDAGSRNIKITTAEDMTMAEALMAPAAHEVRVGQGYDIHAFADGDHVMLCGIRIPHSRGVAAHSDGDVGLHALTDALLGTIGDGDIGQHFKNSDPRWRGASSDRFLADAGARVAARSGRISHLDVTVLAESPKIGPHREAMRARIAAILGISPDRVAIKATTMEGLGAIGRGEGLAAIATATVLLPPS
jgi:2-C-methyl-D-erythritol 4-phosphate cytidylyltransferase/2-C-methyl-D-erythritol 2,4-cyclodiphosphate synthase